MKKRNLFIFPPWQTVQVCVSKAFMFRRLLSDLNPTVTETTVRPRLSSAVKRRLGLIRSPCDTPGEAAAAASAAGHHSIKGPTQHSHSCHALNDRWYHPVLSGVTAYRCSHCHFKMDPNRQTNCRSRSLMRCGRYRLIPQEISALLIKQITSGWLWPLLSCKYCTTPSQHGWIYFSIFQAFTFIILLSGPHKTGWSNTVDRIMKHTYYPGSTRNKHTPSLPAQHLRMYRCARRIADSSVTQFSCAAPVTEETAQIHLAHTCSGGHAQPYTQPYNHIHGLSLHLRGRDIDTR